MVRSLRSPDQTFRCWTWLSLLKTRPPLEQFVGRSCVKWSHRSVLLCHWYFGSTLSPRKWQRLCQTVHLLQPPMDSGIEVAAKWSCHRSPKCPTQTRRIRQNLHHQAWSKSQAPPKALVVQSNAPPCLRTRLPNQKDALYTLDHHRQPLRRIPRSLFGCQHCRRLAVVFFYLPSLRGPSPMSSQQLGQSELQCNLTEAPYVSPIQSWALLSMTNQRRMG